MALFELEVALFAPARALSSVLSTHRSLPGAVTAIFEVYGATCASLSYFYLVTAM